MKRKTNQLCFNPFSPRTNLECILSIHILLIGKLTTLSSNTKILIISTLVVSSIPFLPRKKQKKSEN